MKKRNNTQLAEIFFEMADLYQLKNVRWKPQAYRIAAQTMESLYVDVKDLYKKEGAKGIDNLPGIGEGITKKIVQFLKKGKIDEYEKLKKSLPSGLYSMMKIPGIGAKRASMFYYKKGIKNIDELKKAVKKHQLIGLPGFKQRAEQKVGEEIGILSKSKGRVPLKDAKKVANSVLRELKKIKSVKEAIATGSIRREKPTIGDIDIAVKAKNTKDVIDRFVKSKIVKKVLAKGEKKAIVILKNNMQCDVRVALPEEYGATVLYFTGDKQHDIWLRKNAIKKGYKLNEYGLFEKGKKIAGRTEKSVYDKLGIKMFPPKMRIGEIK